jgi:hypothetical protein
LSANPNSGSPAPSAGRRSPWATRKELEIRSRSSFLSMDYRTPRKHGGINRNFTARIAMWARPNSRSLAKLQPAVDNAVVSLSGRRTAVTTGRRTGLRIDVTVPRVPGRAALRGSGRDRVLRVCRR